MKKKIFAMFIASMMMAVMFAQSAFAATYSFSGKTINTSNYTTLDSHSIYNLTGMKAYVTVGNGATAMYCRLTSNSSSVTTVIIPTGSYQVVAASVNQSYTYTTCASLGKSVLGTTTAAGYIAYSSNGSY